MTQPQVHLHYGYFPARSKKNSMELFRADFEPRLRTQLPVEIKIFQDSEVSDLLGSLQNPQVVGLFWINHPAIVHEDKKMLNSFLQTSRGAFVPKSIAQAAHENFRFFGLVSCHFTDLMGRYFKNPGFPVFFPHSLKIDELPTEEDELLFEVSSIFAAPEIVLDQIRAQWTALIKGFEPRENKESNLRLRVEYRDLLSAKFSYEVFLDDRLIGILDRNDLKNFKEFPLGSDSGTHKVRIRPDDPNRLRRQTDPEHLVDDILLDRVALIHPNSDLSTKELLSQGVHLGDDNELWDRDTKTSLKIHEPDFSRRPVLDQWSWEGSF